ncbi:hypothetical protein BDY24DRAFT_147357 [Mrakia frigida]|uniref:uncharacterized protein n=1 Tax=Mrakia frigida TaxID=29902 RepID=UPI003FCC1342
MVLALNTIWNEGSYSVRVENYRDRYCVEIPPSQEEKYIGARWIDKGASRTVISITLEPEEEEAKGGGSCIGRALPRGKRQAVISLEDIKWELVLTGDVEGGEIRVSVNGNKDFDIVVRKDGKISLRCLGGAFNGNNFQQIVDIPTLRLPPSTQPPSSYSPRADAFSPYLDDPSCSFSHSNSNEPQTQPVASSSSSHQQPVPPNPLSASQSSHALSELSPDLIHLLDELRSDQRRTLQKELEGLGAFGLAERLMVGGRRLMGAVEPSEYLPMTALINVLVIPAIFLFSYCLSARRNSSPTSSSSSPHRRRSPLAIGDSNGDSLTRRMIRERAEEMLALGMMHRPGRGGGGGHGEFPDDDDEAPPPYPEEEGRALF